MSVESRSLRTDEQAKKSAAGYSVQSVVLEEQPVKNQTESDKRRGSRKQALLMAIGGVGLLLVAFVAWARLSYGWEQPLPSPIDAPSMTSGHGVIEESVQSINPQVNFVPLVRRPGFILIASVSATVLFALLAVALALLVSKSEEKVEEQVEEQVAEVEVEEEESMLLTIPFYVKASMLAVISLFAFVFVGYKVRSEMARLKLLKQINDGFGRLAEMKTTGQFKIVNQPITVYDGLVNQLANEKNWSENPSIPYLVNEIDEKTHEIMLKWDAGLPKPTSQSYYRHYKSDLEKMSIDKLRGVQKCLFVIFNGYDLAESSSKADSSEESSSD